MTSWIRVPPKKTTEEVVRPFLFKTSSAEFADEFNQYFYATVYSQSVKRPLMVYDMVNPLGTSYALIKETFVEVPGSSFTDSMMPNVTTLNAHDGTRVIPYVNSLQQDELQSTAASILEWSPSMIKDISVIRTRANIPDVIDVGVHMSSRNILRVSDVSSIVAAYFDAVRQIDTRLKKETLNIFVAAEQSLLLQEFLVKAPSNWKIFTVPQTNMNVNGFSVQTFERQQGRLRLESYKEFVAVLSCLQTCENLITSLSSEVGKFLFMTNTTMTYFRSMEATKFLAR